MNFYVSLFEQSRVLDVSRDGSDNIDVEGKIHHASFEWNRWRRRDLHPGPKIHPRRNLRCVSASEMSFPT